MASVNKLEKDLQANVTCSVCLNLFRAPKIMPECSHTFCLQCLRALAPFLQGGRRYISCPECRTINLLHYTIDHFKTNLIAQNVVTLIQAEEKKKSATVENAKVPYCPHAMSEEDKQLCSHCQSEFCKPCRIYHMEQLKTEALEMGKKAVDETLGMVAAEKMETVLRIVGDEFSMAEAKITDVVDTIRVAFEAALTEKVDTLKKQLVDLKTAQLDHFEALVEELADKEKLSALCSARSNVSSTSVLKQQLEEVASFYTKVSERHQLMSSLEKLVAKKSPLFEFVINDKEINNHLVETYQLSLGQMTLNNDGGGDGKREIDMKDAEFPYETLISNLHTLFA